MRDFSERTEFVGANVTPDVKHSLQEHIKAQREAGNSTSMSRWVEEAILQRMHREAVPILSLYESYTGEPLPFEEIR